MTRPASKSARGYDRLGRVYPLLEFVLFGQQLHRSRVALIEHLASCQHSLVLGDGDGRLLEELCTKLPRCQFLSIDQSQKMLELQRRRLSGTEQISRVQFVQSDLKDFQCSDKPFDLIVAAYLLDCFSETELETHLRRWLEALRPGGCFYFVDFIHPTSGWRKIQSSVYQLLMHSLFRVVTGLPNRRLLDLEAIIATQDLSLQMSAENLHPMMTCRIYQKAAL